MNKFFISLILYELIGLAFFFWLIVNHPFIFGCVIVGLFIFFWNLFRNCPIDPSDNLIFNK